MRRYIIWLALLLSFSIVLAEENLQNMAADEDQEEPRSGGSLSTEPPGPNVTFEPAMDDSGWVIIEDQVGGQPENTQINDRLSMLEEKTDRLQN